MRNPTFHGWMHGRAGALLVGTLLLTAGHVRAQDADAPAPAQPPPTTPSTSTPPATPTTPVAPTPRGRPLHPAVGAIVRDAEAVRPLVTSDLARAWLDEAQRLPAPADRTIYYSRTAKLAFTEADMEQKDREEVEKLELRAIPFDAARYHSTFYGTPISYARAIDLAAVHGLGTFEGKKVVDFGYGTIGQLKMMAGRGATVLGLDVDPILAALYSFPGDEGPVRGGTREAPLRGEVDLVQGAWPRDEAIVRKIGGGIDLFISKNTLKKGYVHPSGTQENYRGLDLGVDDATFLRALHRSLRRGGLVVIYNIGPAPNAEGQPYRAMAEIGNPFPRQAWEEAGFEVLEYDADDQETMRAMAKALRWDTELGWDVEKDFQASYSVIRRKPE